MVKPSNTGKDDEQPRRRRDGEEDGENRAEQQLFAELVQRRLGGGATPNAQAYADAMRQWQALPGAVQFVAVPRFPEADAAAGPTPPTPSRKTERTE